MSTSPVEQRSLFAGADAAFVAQNASLCCASGDLSKVMRSLIERRAPAAALRLLQTERIALAQTVGLPAAAP